MPGNFELEEDGLLKANIGIRAVVGRSDRIQHLVTRAAIAAELTMKANAPHGKTGAFIRSIERSKPFFRPGGPGGGGSYIAVVGVTETPETRSKSKHLSPGRASHYPTMVFHGTGIYGPQGRVIKTAPGNVMRIEGFKARDIDTAKGIIGGGTFLTGRIKPFSGILYTHQVLGQRPQQEWFHEGRRRAELIISSNLHRVFNVNDPIDDI
jgi:hypothetical protein